MLKKLFLSSLCAVISVCCAFAKSYTVDQVPNVQRADSTRHVSNPDGILSAGAQQKIDSLLLDIRHKTTCEVAVVVIDDMAGDTDIDNFATDLFTKWKIGKKDKDNGVLILVAKDARKFVIRTGYGVEGVLPDVTCARIQRRVMAPRFKTGDFDLGVWYAVVDIHTILTDPEAADEIKSELADGDSEDDFTFEDFLLLYVIFAFVITIALATCLAVSWLKIRSVDRHDKYRALRKFQPILGYASIFCLALPVLLYLFIRYKLNYWRNGEHRCPNCGRAMQKVDEVHDNDYLTPSQDKEEQLNSVDYDVWLCPDCGETDIHAFVNPESTLSVCTLCGARACRLCNDRIIIKPTTSREGHGEKVYECMHCHRISTVPYKLPRLETPTVVIIPGGSGRSGGFGGGGFGGGSFGGGMTGGGGASGSW